MPPYASENTHANAITPFKWFVKLYFQTSKDTFLASKLELPFLLGSVASICVLNLHTVTTLADHLLKVQNLLLPILSLKL